MCGWKQMNRRIYKQIDYNMCFHQAIGFDIRVYAKSENKKNRTK